MWCSDKKDDCISMDTLFFLSGLPKIAIKLFANGLLRVSL